MTTLIVDQRYSVVVELEAPDNLTEDELKQWATDHADEVMPDFTRARGDGTKYEWESTSIIRGGNEKDQYNGWIDW